ncbi:acyloxyacyl hydrolase [Flavobacterium polysaccharolyticum]|uniref:Acyloxyacyl hydrolase n=1 Tax=Flavobacterium polysaccharolyticum TaxID=3133148 RepID=A0ABU9NNG2_9FLAO
MILKKTTVFLIVLISSITTAQESIITTKKNFNFIGVGYSMGQTMPPLSIYPETKIQKGFDLTLGTTTYEKDSWAKLLNYPKTGILLSYADFGNQEKVGYGITIMPFFDFGILNKVTDRIRFQIGLGGSYNNLIYNKVTNYGNHAISTHFNWAFRSFLYYDLLHRKDINLKIGGGFTHFSNGHTRWPNLGLNSFLATVKTEFNFTKNTLNLSEDTPDSYSSETQTYYTTRLGFGQKTLYRNYNSLKNVYTASFGMGRIKNKSFKYGLSFYYRFYEDYYDFIKEEGNIITTNFPKLTNNPFQNATAIGIFSNCEVLINHFSVEAELGINLYKPAYKLDWYVNNGSYTATGYIADEFGTKAKTKQYISSRLGFRYYAITAKKAPKHNVFIAANINSNLGQADFSELSFGYVYSPKSKNK